jgi:hypothetical protein
MRLLLLPLVLVACFGDTETVFPPGLEPLGNMKVGAGDPGDSRYPEILHMEAGIDEDIWVHARGYVHGDVGTVWLALQDEQVFIDRRAVSEYTIEWDTEPEYDVSFVVSQTIEDIITVSYEVAFRQGLVEGSMEAPETVSIRFQKIFGTGLVERLEGSILLVTVDEGITEFQFQEHMETPLPDTSDLESYVTDMYAEIVLWVKGEALPIYAD